MSVAIFFILAIIAVLGALMVITARSPVSSALYLILVMCSLAGLFVLLGAIFLAALQIIVYAGAVMILFLFVIMLLNLRHNESGHDPYRFQKYFGIAFAIVILLQGIFIINMAMKSAPVSNVGLIAMPVPAGPTDPPTAIDYKSAPAVA